MENLSLQQVMNDMAQGAGVNATALRAKSSKPIPKVLTELEAFVCIDPLLKHLHQQYVDAKQDRSALTQQYGVNDPMVEIAIDMEDSAWCSMQTRYLELREKRNLMTLAQALIRDSEYAIERVKEKLAREKALELFYYFKMLEKMREVNKPSRALEIWLILYALKVDTASSMRRYNQAHQQTLAA